MRLISLRLFYTSVVFLISALFYPRAIIRFLKVYIYSPLRRVIKWLGALEEGGIRRKAEEITDKTPSILIPLAVAAYPLVPLMRLLNRLLGADQESVKETRKLIEDLDRLFGTDRFD
jgi:hypothetical protein